MSQTMKLNQKINFGTKGERDTIADPTNNYIGKTSPALWWRCFLMNRDGLKKPAKW